MQSFIPSFIPLRQGGGGSLTVVLAVLVALDLLEEEKANKLKKELSTQRVPHDLKEAVTQIKEALK